MQRKAKLVDLLQNDEVKLLLKTHKTDDPVALALKLSGKYSFDLAPVLELLRIYQRGYAKLPTWINREALFTRKAYEQASSEPAAEWKAGLIQGKSLLNLCGGIGVDDFFFSKNFQEVVSLEIDEEVHELAEHNLKLLGAKNCRRIAKSAESYLEETDTKFDWIYLDPDRRDGQRKVFGLEESSPDVLKLWTELVKRAEGIMIKASPMLDISLALQQIPSINEVQVIAIGGEVKEILLIAYPDSRALKYSAVELAPFMSFSSERSYDRAYPVADGGKNYFYECNASLIKSGLCADYLQEHNAEALISNGAFAVSSDLVTEFFGRAFQIQYSGDYSRKKFDRYLKERQIQKANLNRRNFKLKVEELRKLHKLKDGGEDYFFFFIDYNKKARFVHGMKLSV